MASHISQAGFQEDDDGFIWVKCDCGAGLGPAPDEETMLDIAMEHAYQAAMKEWADASECERRYAPSAVLLTADEADVLTWVLDRLDEEWASAGTPQRGSQREVLRAALARQIAPCQRSSCGHPRDAHRLDDSNNVPPDHPMALFRCVGYPSGDTWIDTECGCHDYVLGDGGFVLDERIEA